MLPGLPRLVSAMTLAVSRFSLSVCVFTRSVTPPLFAWSTSALPTALVGPTTGMPYGLVSVPPTGPGWSGSW